MPLLLVLATGSASAQDAGSPPASVAALATMVGSWQVEVEMYRPGGGSMQSEGRSEVRYGPGRRSLIVDFETTSGPMAGFELHQILTWDRSGETFWLHWVDSFSSGATVVQGHARDGSYVFDRQTGEGDEATVHRSVYTALQEESYRAESYVRRDGSSWEPSMTLRYRRVDDAGEK